jgi:ketosteroid isomerase-like protein
MPFGAPRVVGRDELRSRNAATLASADFVASINNLDVGSDGDLAYASGVYTMQITPAYGSPTWTLDAKYLSVFARQANGDWKLIRDAFNSNVPLN